MSASGLRRKAGSGRPAPGPNIAPFHDRQVVVLPVQEWASWLYLDKSEAELLKPLPARSLTVTLARAGGEAPDPALLERQR